MAYNDLSGLSTIVSAAEAAAYIANDPALPQVASRIQTLHSLEAQASAGTVNAQGIGLHRLVKPLDAYITYRKNPWLGYVAVAAALGLPFFLGYVMGKKR